MISINGTLLVQIGAFLWAWWFLNKFLLRPVVAAVEQEDGVQHVIQATLEQHKKQLAAKTRYKQDRWFHFTLLFTRGMPTFSDNTTGSCQTSSATITHNPLTEQEKKRLEHTTATSIARRIADEF